MTEHWVVISVIVFQTFINLYYVIILCSIKSTIIKGKKNPFTIIRQKCAQTSKRIIMKKIILPRTHCSRINFANDDEGMCRTSQADFYSVHY